MSGNSPLDQDGGIDPSRVRDGKLYGCHVDLSDDERPDGCVIEYDAHSDCVYGHLPSGRKRRTPFTCKWWKPVPDQSGAA